MKKWILLSMGICLSLPIIAQQSEKKDYLVMDMVHHNPGDAMTQTAFRNPEKLASFGMNGMVINERQGFIHKYPQYSGMRRAVKIFF